MTQIISIETLVLLSHVFIILLPIFYLFRSNILIKKLFKTLSENSLNMIFLISLSSVIGSLYYSEIVGLLPCKLCWFQRIFLYPISIISGVALYKKDKNVINYIIPLSLIGLIISIYQYIIQLFPAAESSFCIVGGEVSCSVIYTISYGYITLPLMGLTAFLLILIFSFMMNKNKLK